MTVLLECIKNDIRLQYKYGFYHVYVIMSLLYILLIRFTPEEYKNIVTMLVIFSDPALLGFFFIGAIILLEKSERVLTYLVITPLKDWQFILSKMISLTMLSLSSSLLILIFSNPFGVNIILLLIAVAMISFLFVGIGFIAVSKFKTVNDYMFTAVGYVLILLLPVAYVLGLNGHFVLKLWPTYGVLVLMQSVFFPVPLGELILALSGAIFYIGVVFVISKWLFRKYILSEGGV